MSPDAINALTTSKKAHIRGKETLFLSFVKKIFDIFQNKYFPTQSLINLQNHFKHHTNLAWAACEGTFVHYQTKTKFEFGANSPSQDWKTFDVKTLYYNEMM